MLKEVEALQARGFREVGRVRVRGQRQVSVGRVGLGKVRHEVVEAAVVRRADRPDLLEEAPRRFRVRVGRVGDEDEADLALPWELMSCTVAVLNSDGGAGARLTMYLVNFPIPADVMASS